MSSQCDRVLMYLKIHGSITNIEVVEKLRILSISRRIFELKQMGYNIENIVVKGQNQQGKSFRFVRYVLHEL